MDSHRFVLILLACVIGAYLAVALVSVTACLWAWHKCEHVDLKFWLSEPLSALLGLLGGRAIERIKKGE